MKRLLAAAAASASLLFPSAALAVDSGTVTGTGNVSYVCDMTLPGTTNLTAAGADSLTGLDTIGLQQNGDTTYTLSALTVSGPNGSDLLGTIQVAREEGTPVVTNSSTSTAATGNVTGNVSENGRLSMTIQELTTASMLVGNYSVSATVSCAQT